MDINYSEIITKANTRKEVLLKIEAAMVGLPEMETQLAAILARLEEIDSLYTTLDGEGKALVPKPQQQGLNYAGYRARNEGKILLINLRHLCGVAS